MTTRLYIVEWMSNGRWRPLMFGSMPRVWTSRAVARDYVANFFDRSRVVRFDRKGAGK